MGPVACACAAERPRHPGRDRCRPDRDGAVGDGDAAAVVDRRAARPLLPGVREPPLPAHRPGRRPVRPDPRGGARGRRAVHPAPGRVRARFDVRDGDAARRHRCPRGGQVVARPPRPAHPRDRRLRRPGLLRARHTRARERRDPADQALSRDEDRPVLLLPAVVAVGASLRLGEVRLPLPGPTWAHALTLLPELPPDHDLMTSLDGITVAVLGGTGPQGRGLVRRWAAAGIPTVIGSRDADRASEVAAELAAATGGDVRGLANADAAAAADVVVVAVPYDGHADLLRSLAVTLAGKVVVDCVNPL